MADLIALSGTGNFTTAGTWGTVDSASTNDSDATTTVISTSNVDSSTFTPAAATIDGVALKISARAASPSGTFTVTLRNTTSGGVREGTVTVNVSDINANPGNGWFFFKFVSAPAVNGTDVYGIRVVCSSTGSQITLRVSSGTNLSRRLRTTTTQAPASGNHLVVSNELTGANASNAVTVTMENTATTSFGPTVSGGPAQGIVVSNGGTMTWGTGASAYYLKWKGVFLVTGGGTVNVGTSGSRINSSGSAVLEMDSAANLDSYMSVTSGGTVNMYGVQKTPFVQMTVDKIATNTVITVADVSPALTSPGNLTGWAASDKLCFSPTDTTVAHHETKNVTSRDSNTQFTLSAGLTNAHSGTSPTQCYVGNLTRNIVFRGVSTSLRGNFRCSVGATVVLDSVEFTTDKLGTSTSGQRSIDMQITTGSFTCIGCTGNPSAAGAGNNNLMFCVGGATANNFTLEDWVSYDWARIHIDIETATSGTNWTIRNGLCIGGGGDGLNAIDLSDIGGTLTGLRVFGYSGAAAIGFRDNTDADYTANTMDSFEVGLCSNKGLQLGAANAQGAVTPLLTLSNLKAWRCGTSGLYLSEPVRRLVLNSPILFGNASGGGIVIEQSARYLEINSGLLAGDSSQAQPNGITANNGTNKSEYVYVVVRNTTFGVATGIYVAHSTGDLNFSSTNYPITTFQVFANKCTFSSTTTFASLTQTQQQFQGDHIDRAGSFLRSEHHGASGTNKTFVPQGTIALDTAVFNVAPQTSKLTPNTASYKLKSGVQHAPVVSATSRTVSVYVRMSKASTGDSADYNGAQPRLIVRRNDAVGIVLDTVIDTGTVAIGNWEQLTGVALASPSENGTIELYVDCDGTTGFINVGDWSIS